MGVIARKSSKKNGGVRYLVQVRIKGQTECKTFKSEADARAWQAKRQAQIYEGCLHATLAQHLKPHAPGLTPRSVLDQFAGVQMLDVEIPTTDGRTITLTRYTEPEAELRLLLERLRLELPAQPPPKITAAQAESATPV